MIPNSNHTATKDFRYHLPCWIHVKREAGVVDKNKQQDLEEESSNQYTIAQIELINYVSAEMQSGKVLDMNASKE